MKNQSPNITEQLTKTPVNPGVYLMQDNNNQVLYVGKAKHLKNRIRSYFNSSSSLSPKIQQLVHKIESLNAFIACDHTHEGEDSVFFEICDDCGQTKEYSDKKIYSQIHKHTERKNFKITKTTVEIHGRCEDCMDS